MPTKTKVSATLDPERLARARQLTGSTNVSEVLDLALDALIERLLERAHTEGYERIPQGEDVMSPDPAVWADLPWDES
jgi:hypothetical protein